MATTVTQPTQQRNRRLIVFDVEGIVIPKRRYLLFEASRRVSISSFIKMLWAGLLYEAGLTPLETALRGIYRQLHGLAADDLLQLFKRIPLIPGVKEVFHRLKQAEFKIALISSGLPQAFIEDLAAKLDCDYAYGFEPEVADGRLTGKISGDVIKARGKALVLQDIMKKEALTPQNCVLVADDRNNYPMFNLCSIRIGYNPDFLLTYKSDIVVKGDLREILPTLTEDSAPKLHSVSKRDLLRENIHISGFLVALFTMWFSLSHFWVAFVILMVTLTYIVSELSRMLGVNIPIVSTITWNAALHPEVYEFVTAPIFFAFGIMLALLLFPVPVSYASIAIFALGDGFATIFGKTIGTHVFPYNKGKKVEGTVFGFIFALLGALVFVNPLKAVVGAATAMIVETLPAPLNDNLTMPLAAGLVVLFLP
ncbi:MAG TPA: HAD-IB family phosphatase [Candidatus Bathyarchaeia archaeon]|nr:HAD-IB family phosphatase [Candidatus Bathyarchaeia archaeon]